MVITYDPGKWSVNFAFSLHGSVFPKSACVAVPAAIVTGVCHRIVRSGIMMDGMPMKDYVDAGDKGTTMLSSFGFILGFLIVFRAGQAYSRWWEGGTLLQQIRGDWFNAYSSLLAFCNADKSKEADVAKFQQQIVRLVSLLYAAAIRQVSTMNDNVYEVIDFTGFDEDSMHYMNLSHDRCEVVLQWVQRLIVEANAKEILKIPPPILSRVYNQLGNGIVNLNNARKITEFPIPFPLAQMVTIMLLFHWFVTCLVCSTSVERSQWAIALSFIIVFSFWSINYIAVELEMPFGDDPNDLPLIDMQVDLNKSLVALLNEHAMKPPPFAFNVDYHPQMDLKDCDMDTGLLVAPTEKTPDQGNKRKSVREHPHEAAGTDAHKHKNEGQHAHASSQGTDAHAPVRPEKDLPQPVAVGAPAKESKAQPKAELEAPPAASEPPVAVAKAPPEVPAARPPDNVTIVEAQNILDSGQVDNPVMKLGARLEDHLARISESLHELSLVRSRTVRLGL